MGWATYAREALRRGEMVQLRPLGNSMVGKNGIYGVVTDRESRARPSGRRGPVKGNGVIRGVRAIPALSLVLCLICLLGLGGCGGGSMHLDSSDNGKTVSVRQGDEVVITLDENPTTGYVWAIDKIDDQILALKSSDYTSDAPIPGSGGTRTLTFTTKQAGTSPLALKDWRSWEGDKSIVGRFSVTIKVTSGS